MTDRDVRLGFEYSSRSMAEAQLAAALGDFRSLTASADCLFFGGTGGALRGNSALLTPFACVVFGFDCTGCVAFPVVKVK